MKQKHIYIYIIVYSEIQLSLDKYNFDLCLLTVFAKAISFQNNMICLLRVALLYVPQTGFQSFQKVYF